MIFLRSVEQYIFHRVLKMTDLPEFTTRSEAENVSGSQLSLVTLHSFILALRLA